MRIAYVSSEIFPFSKTGGLGDVAAALPQALLKEGCDIKVFTPKYSTIDEEKFNLKYKEDLGEIPIRINNVSRTIKLYEAKYPNSEVDVIFIDCTYYYDRGYLYSNDIDEHERFILFCKGVIETLQHMNWKPDVIHCNDWQTGLIPLLLKDNYSWDKFFNNTATLFTIHNIGYQGRFPKAALSAAEIRGDLFYPASPIEYFDDVSFMKTAINYADIINTVSNTYAKEILTPEFGSGMEPELIKRKDDLYGILNGMDYGTWNPETDIFLPYKFSLENLSWKLKNKKFLLEHINLPFNEDTPLVGIISRMAVQKGFDIFASVVDELMKLNAQWVVLGSGEEEYEDLFRLTAKNYPLKVSVYIGFNNELSHLIEAGADIFLMPSHYEPCGLNQLYSLKYGTVPVVRRTGGLADTIQDWHHLYINGEETGTGFSFSEYSGKDLLSTVKRAVETFKDKDTWNKIQLNGMQKDYSWENSADKYIELYKKAVKKRK